MEFFIALFGILFFLFKFIGDKASESVRQNNVSNVRKQSSYIYEHYCAKKEDSEWAENIIWKNHDPHSEVYNIFEEDFEYALGKDWREKLNLWINPQSNIHIKWMYRLLLSTRGKIPGSDTISISWCDRGSTKEECIAGVKLLQRAEKRLFDQGITDIKYVCDDGWWPYERSPLDDTIESSIGRDYYIEAISFGRTKRMWEDYKPNNIDNKKI